MVQQQSFSSDWLKLLVALNDEQQWNLNEYDIHTYLHQLERVITQDLDESQLRTIFTRFHHEHAVVIALLNDDATAWDTLARYTSEVLRKTRRYWSRDPAIDGEDYTQIALAALHNAIRSFQYRSKFSTWCHAVIIRAVKRTIRNGQAQKRAIRPESLDDQTPVPAVTLPEMQARLAMLKATVQRILETEHDTPLDAIFRLWFYDGYTADEIGRILQLRGSRVRTLLRKARTLLREHPDLQGWVSRTDDPEMREEP